MFGLRKRKSGKGSHGKGAAPVRNKSAIRTARKLFHGVSIQPEAHSACDAAQALERRRFLADDAPMLPLSDCPNPAGCRCRYQHFDDRRTDARRESDVGMPMKDHPQDVRNGVGRRVTDG